MAYYQGYALEQIMILKIKRGISENYKGLKVYSDCINLRYGMELKVSFEYAKKAKFFGIYNRKWILLTDNRVQIK